MSMIALFAVVAFNDACRFCTLGRSSEMTSIGMSRGSLANPVSTLRVNTYVTTRALTLDATTIPIPA